MRNLLFTTFLLYGFFFLSGQESSMSNAEIASFKTLVTKTSQATNTIQSDFVQYKHLDFLANDIITEGSMAFKTPNKVKWEYTKPFQYSVIFMEDQLLINDGGTKSNVDLGNSTLFKKLNQLIVNSVKGNLLDDADFKTSYYQDTEYNKVVFTPKDEKIKKYIASFILIFDKNQGNVREVKMVEPSNDFTRIVFKNRIINKPLADEVFSN